MNNVPAPLVISFESSKDKISPAACLLCHLCFNSPQFEPLSQYPILLIDPPQNLETEVKTKQKQDSVTCKEIYSVQEPSMEERSMEQP
jgi:hypothetical protein